MPEPYRPQDLEERGQAELRLGIEPLRPLLRSRLPVHPRLHEEAGLLGSMCPENSSYRVILGSLVVSSFQYQATQRVVPAAWPSSWAAPATIASTSALGGIRWYPREEPSLMLRHGVALS